MKNEILTPKMLEEYYNYFIKENPSFDILDNFLGSVICCMNLEDDLVFKKDMMKVLEKAEPKSESKEYLDKYCSYVDSLISLVLYLECNAEEKDTFDMCNNFFDKFCELYKNNFKAIKNVLELNCNMLLVTFFNKFNISMNGDPIALAVDIEKKTNLVTSAACFGLLALTNSKDEHYSNLQIIFTTTILFVVNINILLHDKEPKDVIPKKYLPNIGRNDPCPCGSGKKYKKCCDGKIIS